MSSSLTISAGRVCPRGQVFSDCVSSCPPTCASPNTLGLAPAMAQCREECVGGCECPPGLYLHMGRCLKRDDCPCFHRRRTYQSGDRIEQRCNTWYGSFSCLCVSSLHLPLSFFLFSPPIMFTACAVLASGSALGRNVQRSAALWGRCRWPHSTKRGIGWREETALSLP